MKKLILIIVCIYAMNNLFAQEDNRRFLKTPFHLNTMEVQPLTNLYLFPLIVLENEFFTKTPLISFRNKKDNSLISEILYFDIAETQQKGKANFNSQNLAIIPKSLNIELK